LKIVSKQGLTLTHIITHLVGLSWSEQFYNLQVNIIHKVKTLNFVNGDFSISVNFVTID